MMFYDTTAVRVTKFKFSKSRGKTFSPNKILSYFDSLLSILLVEYLRRISPGDGRSMVLLVLVLHYILPMSAQHARKETVTDSLNLYTLYKKHTMGWLL